MLLYEAMNSLATLVVSHVRDTACVYNANVSYLTLLRLLHPTAHELLHHTAGLCKIELAAQGEIGSFLVL